MRASGRTIDAGSSGSAKSGQTNATPGAGRVQQFVRGQLRPAERSSGGAAAMPGEGAAGPGPVAVEGRAEPPAGPAASGCSERFAPGPIRVLPAVPQEPFFAQLGAPKNR